MAEQTRPSAIVQDVDSATVSVAQATDVELLTAVRVRWEKLRERRPGTEDLPGDVSREFALGIGHVEDAINRGNRGRYRLKGIFGITDAERTV